MQHIILNTGAKMPMLGLGVYKIGENAGDMTAMQAAFDAGYRSLDTAAAYDNEQLIGEAVRKSGINRSELFITTKLSNPAQRSRDVEGAFAQSLADLGMDYVDLYLIHWPVAECYVDSWLAMEKIYKSGRAKAIGVSNFQDYHIAQLKKVWSITPAINQIELHPRLTQKPLLEICKAEGITSQSWSPLGGRADKDSDFKENLLTNPVLTQIGEKYGKTAAQVILRWNIDQGIVAIPKSVTPSRIQANIDIFDFALTQAEVQEIDALNKNERTGPNPDNFDF